MCACNIDIFNHEKINDLNNVYKYNLVICSLFCFTTLVFLVF